VHPWFDLGVGTRFRGVYHHHVPRALPMVRDVVPADRHAGSALYSASSWWQDPAAYACCDRARGKLALPEPVTFVPCDPSRWAFPVVAQPRAFRAALWTAAMCTNACLPMGTCASARANASAWQLHVAGSHTSHLERLRIGCGARRFGRTTSTMAYLRRNAWVFRSGHGLFRSKACCISASRTTWAA
jgi:hypothetical protein